MDFDCVVAGAGVTGLATTLALSRQGFSILLVEPEETPGTGISSRNSEVVHSGIYYRPGSWKERLCLRGRELLYEFCRQKGVPVQKTGKLLPVTDTTPPFAVDSLRATCARLNIPLFSREEMPAGARKIAEDFLRAREVWFTPETGIVDSHRLIREMENQARQNAGDKLVCLFGHRVVSGHIYSRKNIIGIRPVRPPASGPPEAGETISCRWFINCAGLAADALSRLPANEAGAPLFSHQPGGLKIVNALPRHQYWAGRYVRLIGFSLPGRVPVYPLRGPGAPGLGVHLTPDLGGSWRLGPDARHLKNRRRRYPPLRESEMDAFFESVRPWLPALEREKLGPDQTGIRPKIREKNGWADFVFLLRRGSGGNSGWIDGLGLESPGLTAALALGEEVSGLILGSRPRREEKMI